MFINHSYEKGYSTLGFAEVRKEDGRLGTMFMYQQSWGAGRKVLITLSLLGFMCS